METTKHETNSLSILAGGEIIPVTFKDGREGNIKVFRISLIDMDKLGSAWNKPMEEAMLYVDKTQEWVESLTEDSCDAVLEKGRELNEGPFGRFFRRRVRALEAMGAKLPDVLDQNSKRYTNSSLARDTETAIS